MIKAISILCSCLCAATGLAQPITSAISNLGQPLAGDDGVESAQVDAVSFTTGVSKTWFHSVSILIFGSESGFYPALNPPGAFAVSLYQDAGGSPGSLLATLSGNSFPTNSGIYVYTNDTALEFSNNATYWIVASSINSTNVAEYQWQLTANASLDAGSIWTQGPNQFNTGSGWRTSAGYAQFSVAVETPPAPVILISQPVVLTFTNLGFPFVLQQNSSLATTNWVSVTNATLNGVIGNQTVFIVPPSGQQLFYRLTLP